MGQVSTEQTVKIIESVAEAIKPTETPIIQVVQPDPNYWWLLSLAIIPVLLTFFLQRRKTLSKKKEKE